MNRLVESIWLLTLALFLAMTVSSAIGPIGSTANSFEEISLEVTELEASEQLLERRREKHLQPTVERVPFLPPALDLLNNLSELIVVRSERDRLNGFGGFQLI